MTSKHPIYASTSVLLVLLMSWNSVAFTLPNESFSNDEHIPWPTRQLIQAIQNHAGPSIVHSLIATAPLNVELHDGSSPLLALIDEAAKMPSHRAIDYLKHMLRKDISILNHVHHSGGETALMQAVKRQQDDLVLYLMSEHSETLNWTVQDHSGLTALEFMFADSQEYFANVIREQVWPRLQAYAATLLNPSGDALPLELQSWIVERALRLQWAPNLEEKRVHVFEEAKTYGIYKKPPTRAQIDVMLKTWRTYQLFPPLPTHADHVNIPLGNK